MAAKRKRSLPEVLTPQEQALLLRAPNRRYPTGRRNYTVMRLMLNTGLRVSEAVGVQFRDINFNTGEIRVHGKGGKDRVLFVHQDDLDALDAWIKMRRTLFSCDNGFSHVFITHGGKPLSTRYVHAMVRRMAKRAGLEKRVFPHLLRHTFATDLLRKTKNLRVVQEAMGHEDISTTTIYTRIVNDELREAMVNLRA